MVNRIPVLTGQPTSDYGDYVAYVDVDSATDTEWRIPSRFGKNDGQQIGANFLTVDNLNNPNVVNVAYGPFSFDIPQYNRLTVPLTLKAGDLTISIPAGVCRCYLSEKSLGVDAKNDYAIAQQAGLAVVYTTVTKTTSGNQLPTDLNKQIDFIPTAADITYTLQSIASGAAIDGWFNPRIRNSGTKKVSIVPAVGEVINGVFTPAKPLVLEPGDSGSFMCNGSQWDYKGRQTYTSADLAVANTVVYTDTHNMQLTDISDVDAQMFIRCLVNDGVYVAGDILRCGWGGAQGAGAANQMDAEVIADPADKANKSIFIFHGANGFSIGTYTAGANFNVTAARWNWFYKLVRHW